MAFRALGGSGRRGWPSVNDAVRAIRRFYGMHGFRDSDADAGPREFGRVRVRALAAGSLVALAVGACAMTPTNDAAPRASVSAPASIQRQQIVGRWGIASFHTDKDRRRTEAEARGQCSQPYTIAVGPTDGVMMHVADDPKLYELRLKGDSAGRTYHRLRGSARRSAGPRDPVVHRPRDDAALRRSGCERALRHLRLRALRRLTMTPGHLRPFDGRPP